MPRMIELIRQSAVPPNLMRVAARGALSLPVPEMVEVLVHLTTVPLFAPQAQLTLAGWDETVLAPALSDPDAPAGVLEYFLTGSNLRAQLLPALLANPAVTDAHLADLAAVAPPALLPALCAIPRALATPAVLQVLRRRSDLPPDVADKVAAAAPADTAPEMLDPEFLAYLAEHAIEIAAAGDAPFQLIGASPEEKEELAQAGLRSSTLAARALGARERTSVIQKISRLTVGERILLALKGTREERAILVRDGVRIVADAVLHSPRLSEQEVDLFAAQRSVSENVLRTIAGSRKFMRRYAVRRLLTANPRCPVDVVLPLTKELLLADLESLAKNRNVSETVRRFAWRTLQAKQQHK